jgi:hypothetical protein
MKMLQIVHIIRIMLGMVVAVLGPLWMTGYGQWLMPLVGLYFVATGMHQLIKAGKKKSG